MKLFNSLGIFTCKSMKDNDITEELLSSCESETKISTQVVQVKNNVETVVEQSGKLDFGGHEQGYWDSRYMINSSLVKRQSHSWFRPSCFPISLILVVVVLVVILSVKDKQRDIIRREAELVLTNKWLHCEETCRLSLVESIPVGLQFNSSAKHLSVFESWRNLIRSAQKSIHISSFYWSLRGKDNVPDPSDWQGEEIMLELLLAGVGRKVDILIAQNAPTSLWPQLDTKMLAEKHAAKVRSVDFERLLGAGVLHTKMWVVDGKHAYIGSANMDWRSLTQVKELGAVIYNCSCVAEDLDKIFQVYWDLGAPNSTIPPRWPDQYATRYNMYNPLPLAFNGTPANIYFSSSPPSFGPTGRNDDLSAIVDVISKARRFIYVAVMDYFPLFIYTENIRFWPVIDNKLREASINDGVEVRLLASYWNSTAPSMLYFLRSLEDVGQSYRDVTVQVKLFEVPDDPSGRVVPFTRVNHNKYMVTDQVAYIGTSNWSGDYFTNTGGIGFVINETLRTNVKETSSIVRQELLDIFLRDWNSEYAKPLSRYDVP